MNATFVTQFRFGSMERLALLSILVLAPHTKLPGLSGAYMFRPADLALLGAALLFLHIPMRRNRHDGKTVRAMAACMLLSILSMAWGIHHLSLLGLTTLIERGVAISYPPIAARKLLLLVICFLGFQFLVRSRAVDDHTLLKYWFYGLVSACAAHVLTYAMPWDPLMKRAGVFVEGNHGGSYYLLSFFLMWWSARHNSRFGTTGMALSVVGIILAQSTTAFLILSPLAVIAHLTLPRSGRKRSLGYFCFGVLTAFVIFLVILLFGDEIMAKLVGEELTPASFSRYDRLSSIVSGLDMFASSPIFGVGIQGYAFALPEYVDEFIESFFDWNSRRIANNIYVELLAEQGFVGLSALLLVIHSITRPAFRTAKRNVLLCLAYASVFTSWLAFPTYTISFHWIGFALLFRLSRHETVESTHWLPDSLPVRAKSAAASRQDQDLRKIFN